MACLSIILITVLFSLISQVFCQYQAECDKYQALTVGQTYYIYNPTYPNYFGPNIKCRWIANAPKGYIVDLQCPDVSIATSQDCAADRVAISLTGNPDFVDGHNYCGTGSLSLVSTTTSMSIGLFSMPDSPGGRISCEIRAKLDTSTPTPTPKPPSGCDCGWRQQRRIVGGTETGINEYPFAAALIDSEKRKLFCGATIIHYHYAITAAHCLIKIINANTIGLLVGDHNYNRPDETNTAALYPLRDFTFHEQYNDKSKENDIGIVRTQVDMTFSSAVGPVCLPFRYSNLEPPVHSSVTVLGWGTTEFTGAVSDVLLAANLSVVANSFCQTEHNGLNHIYPTQICTYQEDKDACQSDSGGPIVHFNSNSRRLHLVGVISYGIGCGMDYPGINTRTTSYMEWIIRKTPDASYCRK